MILRKTVWNSKMSKFERLVVLCLNVVEFYNSFLMHTSWTVMLLLLLTSLDQYFLSVDLFFSMTRAMSIKLFSAWDKYCRALANDLLTPLGQKSYTLFVQFTENVFESSSLGDTTADSKKINPRGCCLLPMSPQNLVNLHKCVNIIILIVLLEFATKILCHSCPWHITPLLDTLARILSANGRGEVVTSAYSLSLIQSFSQFPITDRSRDL
ncbi:hypothetical protein AGLY_012221 [Aphis glycines]|uniref:Uncharacterized protein n=1 Tax=Aphis glycines TaxID=307491 RepID=A0A6G0T9M0_APHGL|nr:hypothetical protein AGLY_012221 [Aphis glycines]